MTDRATLEQIADELLARGETLEPRLNEYIPHKPSEKQAAFLSAPVTVVREAFYGGAAGGGKSDALLMAALQYVDVPGYSAVLIRQTYPMLDQPGALIPRAKEWLFPTGAVWNQGRHSWEFPSGAVVVFRHLTNEQAVRDYQSAEYDFIGVDEVTDFSLEQYRFLFSRLRRLAASEVPLRMRCASNPTGPGRDWVHQRFLVEGPSKGRVYVPARLEDNPYLDQRSYEESLVELGSVMYRQLRFGDWSVKQEGTAFKRAWFSRVTSGDVPGDVGRVRRWDLAATETPKGKAARKANDPDWTVGLRLARSRQGDYFVEDVVRFREGPARTEQRIAEVARTDGRAVPIRMEQEPGASGKSLVAHYRREVLDGYDFRGFPSSGSKETRAKAIAARCEAGDVRLVEGAWIEDFLDELTAFPDGTHDDQVDAFSGAYEDLAGKPRAKGVSPLSMTGSSHWRGV